VSEVEGGGEREVSRKEKRGKRKKKGLWRLYDSRSKKGRREKEMSGGERRGGMESWMN